MQLFKVFRENHPENKNKVFRELSLIAEILTWLIADNFSKCQLRFYVTVHMLSMFFLKSLFNSKMSNNWGRDYRYTMSQWKILQFYEYKVMMNQWQKSKLYWNNKKQIVHYCLWTEHQYNIQYEKFSLKKRELFEYKIT